ncbi:MAG: AAA family ATPase [Rhizobiales bacterium]|nr:AAA family ATPase [Hyphomicrobiales bacterium]
MPIKPLATDKLRRRCDAKALGFKTTKDLEPVKGLIGQDRALDALEFGTGLHASGYNIFVLGAPGSGRHNAVRRFLNDKAATMPAPDDWVYVHNFEEAHRPLALRLKPGQARQFAEDLDAMVDGLKTAMPAVFETEDYQERRGAIENEFKESQGKALTAIAEKANKQGFSLAKTQQGFAIVPVVDGAPMAQEAFNALPEEERKVIQDQIAALYGELEEIMQSVPRQDKERREKVRNLNRQLAEVAVGRAMAELFERYGNDNRVKAQLEAIEEDLVNNAALFVQAAQQEADGADGTEPTGVPLDRQFNRYKANVFICQTTRDHAHAPIEYSDFPALAHLLGRIEHVPHMGAMLTDFTLIKPGALHMANGGYLIVDAERLLTLPGSWQALKRCLRSKAIAIEPPAAGLSTTTAVTLEPQSIPLDIKIILIGRRDTFYMLQAGDPEFSDLFKVAADFDEVIGWSAKSIQLFCRLLGSIARREDTRELNADACAAVIERAARLAGDTDRLTLRVGQLADIIREANYWAGKDNARTIKRVHIESAVSGQIRRVDRIRERMHEQILRDTILIDTAGSDVGQINGLSVLQIGSFSFGKPTRITARTRVGQGQVVDIEREVELGGSLHSKGVLILSGFLAARYARHAPVSLSASLVFEQSYGGVDGDSASSTELYAILSSLSGVPINQGLAVTGSVNQNGEVQAIGGANEKIEGFFDICSERGLTGDQGVLVPASNVKHLMLREDVITACKKGQFRIYSVKHIDEGIEILTGTKAGKRGKNGSFPAGSINRMVEDKLAEFAAVRRDYFGMGNRETV